MQIQIALRWMRALWFLSLDLWRPFANDLWLGIPELASLHLEMQELLNPAEEFPSFGSDPRSRCYKHLQQLQKIYGSTGLRYLSDWQRLVFVQGGSDRVEQSAWNQLGSEMLSRKSLSSVSYAALQEWSQELDERETTILKKLKLSKNLELTTWDREALQAEGETVDSVFDLIQNISSANAFVSAWEHHCAAKGADFLTEVFKEGERYTSSAVNPHLLFSAELLPFPSSWEISRFREHDVKSTE